MAKARSLATTIATVSALLFAVSAACADDPDRQARDHDRQTLLNWTAGWNILVWPAGSTLTGCFFLGERAHRQSIADAAHDWSTSANIRFDFGHAPGYRDCDGERPSVVRIGFRMSLASQSHTGTLALDAATNRPNVFIGIGGVATRPIQEIREAALHEIGHFLGLPHEHQHPASPCPAEFKIQAVCERQDVFATYSDRERTEMLEMMQGQVRLRRNPANSPHPAYDAASIMHYRFPAGLLSAGTASACHTFAARTLSDGDRAKSQERYPADPAAQRDFLRAQALTIAEAIGASGRDAASAHRIARLAETYVARAYPDLDFVVRLDPAHLAAAAARQNETASAAPAIGAEAAQCQPRAP